MTFDHAAFTSRMEAFCAGLPGAEAYIMVHHPAYRVKKKPFLIIGVDGDEPGMSIKVSKEWQPVVLENDQRFRKTPYIGQHGWITLDLGKPHTWEEIERFVQQSYEGVAPKVKGLSAGRRP